ncbi:MAG: hypothetical protein O3A20_08870 [Planctomycetota bacterium]|nr:hypothetical protein [Planctomycetota bacterium]
MILTLTLSLLAAQSVQDMTLVNGQPDNATTTVSGSGRAAAYCDDFNRANGPLGADWATGAGTFDINGNQVDCTGTFSYTDNTVANHAASDTTISIVTGPTTGALIYTALRIGVNSGGNNFYVKLQDQLYAGSYSHYGFYLNNGSNPGGPYGIFGALALPFTQGKMTVSYDSINDRLVMDLDEFNDGTVEQTVYSGSGASAYALAGTSHGIGSYGSHVVDSFEINGGCGGGPGFTLAKSGACPGLMTLDTTNGTPSAPVAILHGLAGVFIKPSGACAGITLGIANPSLGVMLGANGSGAASVSFNAAAGFCGRTVQAVDVSSCTASNTIVL